MLFEHTNYKVSGCEHDDHLGHVVRPIDQQIGLLSLVTSSTWLPITLSLPFPEPAVLIIMTGFLADDASLYPDYGIR